MNFSIRPLLMGLAMVLASSAALAKSNHIQFVSTYLQPGTTHPDQNYLAEFLNDITAVHIGPEFFGSVRDTLKPKQVLFDLPDELFNFKDGSLLPNYQETINNLGTRYVDGYEKTILAFYIADEPSDYGITRTSLELVIKALNKRFPGIPTYIVWDQNCFDNSPDLDAKCGLSGQRGIPAGVDWVGFDWYLRHDPRSDVADFNNQIIATVERMKKVTDKAIVLVPDGTDEFVQSFAEDQKDSVMANRMKMFFDYAEKEPRIIGLDNYAWANHREVLHGVDTYVKGTREYPLTKKMLFDLTARSLR